MIDILDSGIRLIVVLQSLGASLNPPMRFFSFLGNEEFFLLFMPALYWCLEAAIGLRVGIMLLVSSTLNDVLKLVFRGPRPYFYSTQVKPLAGETSFGVPSGHAQNSAAVWGLLAALVTRKNTSLRWLVESLAVLLVFLIGLSRLFLGVHFPHDVLFGWIIGGLLVWVFLKLEAPIRSRLAHENIQTLLIAMFGASLVMILLGALVKLSLGAWTIPAAWMQNVRQAGSGIPAPDPLALSGIISNAGALFGLVAGALWLHQRGGFDTSGIWWKRFLRYPAGVAGVVVLWYGMGAIFPRGELLIPYLLRYLRYALVGFWISGLAPVVFMRLGLATPPPAPSQPLQVEPAGGIA